MPRKIEEVEQSLTVSGWGVVSPGTTVEVHQGAWGVGPLGAIHSGVGVPVQPPESLAQAFDRLQEQAAARAMPSPSEPKLHPGGLVWFDAPAPSPGDRVIEPRLRASNVWDFLMRASFSQGMPRPKFWVKVALEEYFKLQEEYHRAATTNVWSK